MIITSAAWYFIENESEKFNNQTTIIEREEQKINKKLKDLSGESKKYYSLSNRIQIINNKILSINTLTSNLIRHYKPILVIELLQLLRPENLWFYYIEHDHNNSIIKIGGSALENEMIANYITTLKKTKNKNRLDSNLISQIYFSNTSLESISKSSSATNLFKEKDIDAALLEVINDTKLDEKNSLNQFPNYSTKNFSDIKGYPEFKLNLKYDEFKKKT